MTTIVLVWIRFNIIETKFDFKFEVDPIDSTLDVDEVIFNGTLIKFPFNVYYVKGNLIIDDKKYNVNIYKRESNPYLDAYRINLVDEKNNGFFNGYARLIGDITQNSLQSMYISIDITDKNTGFTKGEHINCYPSVSGTISNPWLLL